MPSRPEGLHWSSRIGALIGVATIVSVIAWLLSRSGANGRPGGRDGGQPREGCSTEWTSKEIPAACDGNDVEFRARVNTSERYQSIIVPGQAPDTELTLRATAEPTPLVLRLCDLDTFTLSTRPEGGVGYAVVMDSAAHNVLTPGGNQPHASYCAGAGDGHGVWKIADGQLWSANDALTGFAVRENGSTLSATADGKGFSMEVQWRKAAGETASAASTPT